MITFRHKGNFKNTEDFCKRSLASDYMNILNNYARQGVNALSIATPKDTGNTAHSWRYEITRKSGSIIISWLNSEVEGDIPVAILIQYGHGTRNGGYVQGRDFINPTLKPLFNTMANEIWKEVVK